MDPHARQDRQQAEHGTVAGQTLGPGSAEPDQCPVDAEHQQQDAPAEHQRLGEEGRYVIEGGKRIHRWQGPAGSMV
jgi:hypothetical protein